MKTKIEIKSIFGSVLFDFEKENNSIKDTLVEAVKQGADLRGAYLQGAYLRGADLQGAYLQGADLRGADLRGAYLQGADLQGAYLQGAYLQGAYLRGAYLQGVYLQEAYLQGAYLQGADLQGADLQGAYLQGAYLQGAYLQGAYLGEWGKLQSSSDILIVGTIGSRNGYTTIFHTDKGIFVMCGCFKGTLEEFEVKVKKTYHGNNHERDYLALIQFAKVKFEL